MNWLFRRQPKTFNAVETLVLAALGQALPPDIREIFDDHVKSVNLVQRHGDGREVNMYRLKGRELTFPTLKLKADKVEAKIAKVILVDEESGRRVVAQIWTVRGHLFQIMFNAPMTKLRTTFRVSSVELLGNIHPVNPAVKWSIPERLADAGNVSDAAPPLSEDRRRDALSWIGADLPQDYLEVMSRVDGFQIGNWTVLGLETVYETPGMPGTYVVAESRTAGDNGSGVGLIFGEGHISRISFDELDETVLPNGSFVDALLAQIRQ